jgi:hypothetical protein
MACRKGEASTAPAIQTAFAKNLLRLSVELSECVTKHLSPAKSPDAGPLRPEYQIAAPYELAEPVDAWTFIVFPGLRGNSAQLQSYQQLICRLVNYYHTF